MASIGQKLSSAVPHIHQREPDVEAGTGDDGVRIAASAQPTAIGAPRKRKAATAPSTTTKDENNLPLARSISAPHPTRESTFRSFGLGKDTSKLHPPPLGQCLMNIVKYSWLNLLLLCVPVSWALDLSHKASDTIVFVFSLIAIIPLAGLLGFATEELALRVGPTLGGLFNATASFGNAVELIISIIALRQNKLRIVQASLLGSFLSNCLLVLGMCFFAGGLRFHEQSYGVQIAQQQISLLSLSVFSVVVPAAFLRSGTDVDTAGVLAISRATSIVLLICYAAYLVFQLFTHKYLYTIQASKLNSAVVYHEGVAPEKKSNVFSFGARKMIAGKLHGTSSDGKSSDNNHVNSSNERNLTEQKTTASPAMETNPLPPTTDKKNDDPSPVANGRSSVTHQVEEEEDEEEEQAQLTYPLAIALLVVVTVVTGVTAEFLVSSIDGMTAKSHINPEFTALILLAIVGNAAEHVTAVTVSVKNKLDLAMGVAIGSSIQIFLFVLPFLVVLAWGMDKPLTLAFDVFETIIVTLAVIVVAYAIGDGKTNWLEGFVLIILYVIIAIAAWFHKGEGLE
ncbi:related to Ca2+-transport (H+/Ca2+ exchange) protein [Serendipita indica DSM 11827]|uniref:Related to Ca2+-transport (H+/Ca2+ exchange) protein n=1 Tax=Serendipita indica (strain DSM 11827) TaxID=1109443 RepID=G4T8P6_SERID|nr:related to Ca2+-transport (H+/Ca2+ exchange) protein [Serendipita indica DSM 11827]